MSDKLYLYPVIIRIWHVLNAICILGLIVTGASMQAIGSQLEFIDFKLAVKVHDIFGIILSVNYLLFILANIKTGNTKHYFYRS